MRFERIYGKSSKLSKNFINRETETRNHGAFWNEWKTRMITKLYPNEPIDGMSVETQASPPTSPKLQTGALSMGYS